MPANSSGIIGNPAWKGGTNGMNLNGRPKNQPSNPIKEFLRKQKSLPKDIFDTVHPLLKSEKENIRIWAAEFLRDTAYGKPAPYIEADLGNGDVLVQVVSYSIVNTTAPAATPINQEEPPASDEAPEESE